MKFENITMNLNTDFTYTTLQLKPDSRGDVVATLISSKHNQGNRKSALYIHGYIDYFFHPHLAEVFHKKDFDFYALDLRKSGRSILKHQRPYYIESVEEYFEDIDAALSQIQANGSNAIYLLGHSTGGLTVPSYMAKYPNNDSVKGCVLISPFLDMPQPTAVTNGLYPIIKSVLKLFPNAKVNGVVSSVYVKSIHKDYNGEWDFDTTLKPINGFPTYLKWIVAIRKAQLALQNEITNKPILILHASKSHKTLWHSKKVMTSDVVLDVKDMQRLGPKLGNQVTLVAIENGMHDVFLSEAEVRENAFNEMFSWLDKVRA